MYVAYITQRTPAADRLSEIDRLAYLGTTTV